MNTSGAVLPVASDPADAALDGVLVQMSEVLDGLNLDHLNRLSHDTLLSLVSKAAALGRGAETILAAAGHEVAVRSDPVLGAEGLATRFNYPRPSHLLEQIAGVSSATANRLIRVGSRTSRRVSVGQALPPLFPQVAEAFRAGMISIETADVITRELTLVAPRADAEHLTMAERALVDQAAGTSDALGLPVPTDLVAVQARAWRDRLDERGIEARAEKAFHNRDFWVRRTAEDGLIAFGGRVTLDVGAKLHALLDAVLSLRTDPRFVPDTADEGGGSDSAHAVGGGDRRGDAPATGTSTAPVVTTGSGRSGKLRDTRTAGQQRADVFAAMIDSLARSSDAPTVSGAARP